MASKDTTPSFVYISPDPLGVNTFLILGQKGLEEAGKRHNAKTKVLESDDPTSRAENVRWAAKSGATVVIVLGFEFSDVLAQVAPQAPQVQFLIVDQCMPAPPPNVHCAVFREHELAYLLGAIGAWLSPTRHVAAIGALDIPFLHRYTDGFTAGARHVDPEIQVSIRWVGGENPFSDPARAKEQALALAAAGAGPIFTATGAGNFGVFEAAKEKDFLTFGIDINQCPSAPGHVVDNLAKRVDRAIVESVDAILAGTAPPLRSYGLADGGLVLASLDPETAGSSQCVLEKHPDVLQKARDLRQEIIDGRIQIPDPMAAGK